MSTAFTPTLDNRRFAHDLGKIVCIGRNYAAHAAELNNAIPQTPLLFIKPATAAAVLEQPFAIPRDRGAVHHEVELAILIGKKLVNAEACDARNAIAGLGIALDLTLRDVQDALKKDGHPWERAKSFDGAYPVSGFVSAAQIDLQNIDITLARNGNIQQRGNTAQMLFPVLELLSEISHNFTLLPGDIVSTGTPAGVGALSIGDCLNVALRHDQHVLIDIDTQVI